MNLAFGLPMKIAEVKATSDEWSVEGYCSTFGNVDLGKDVVVDGAFDRTLDDGHRVKFLHSHDPRLVLGVPQVLKPDSKGLFGAFKFSKTQLGEETHRLVQDGAIDSFSIGYIPKVVDWTEKGEVRQLKDVDLLEVSLVAMPMNPEAQVTRVKDLLTLTGRAGFVNDELAALIADLTGLTEQNRPLTEAKRRELTQLLETFSGVDAVRQKLESLLASDPALVAPGGKGLTLRLAMAHKRHALTGTLKE